MAVSARSAGAGVHVKVLENAVLAVLAVVGALKAPRVQAGHEDEVVLSWNVVSKPPPLARGSGRNRFTSTKKTAIARPAARPMRAVSWMGSRTQEPTCSQTPAESKRVHTRSSQRVHMRQPTCSQTLAPCCPYRGSNTHVCPNQHVHRRGHRPTCTPALPSGELVRMAWPNQLVHQRVHRRSTQGPPNLFTYLPASQSQSAPPILT